MEDIRVSISPIMKMDSQLGYFDLEHLLSEKYIYVGFHPFMHFLCVPHAGFPRM